MCGIAGILTSNLAPELLDSRLAEMQRRLRHRGPDDRGVYVDASARTGLAHTRLAIQDLSPAGHQPMASRDGRFHIVFNGEIYNFPILRQELMDAGETFCSHSDTEVVLRLYQRHGPQMVRRLQGMFALAIWDQQRRCCFLARDPLGIKPLYLWQQGRTLAFASEVRALLHANLGAKRVCPEALRGFLLFGSVQEPHTLVDGIEALPAGHFMLWQDGNAKTESYWDLQFHNQLADEAVDQVVRGALEESIRRHFVSDVPVGVFLSGGIDSTALVAIASRTVSENLQTFCISFDDAEYNEGDLAARTARHFGTDHYDWRMTAEDGRRLLGEFLTRQDQPSNDGFNTFCISKFAHEQGVKVVLSGLGGDEVFGGYPSFRTIPRMMSWHRKLGFVAPMRRWAADFAERRTGQNKLQRLAAFLRTGGDVAAAYWTMRGIFTPTEVNKLVHHYTDSGTSGLSDQWYGPPPSDQPTLSDSVSYLEMTRYMRNQLLRDSDVMSMAWGLELRVPLVDRTLIETVGRVPSRLRHAAGKRLLLDAVPEVPTWIARQPKRGFRFPFATWVTGEWKEMFLQVERSSPVRLDSWYRRWCLLTLDHFLRESKIDAPRLAAA